jgi:electron transport complex protein RnfB
VAVTARCAGCGACLLTCPVHAIRPLGGTLLVRAELCTGCLECVEVCPVDAVEETSAAVPVAPAAAPAAENSADTAVEPPEERP